jgi:tetratricopeptide (TPR) repeat protein
VAGVALLVAVAASIGGYHWLTRPPAPLESRFAIALVPFIDRTGEENGAVLAGMAADFLSIDLEASRIVRSVGPRRTAPLAGQVNPGADPGEIARRVGRGTSVDYVLLGTLYRERESYLASAELTPVVAGLPEIPELRGEGATVVELVENLGASLRGSLPDISRLDAWRDSRVAVADLTSESELAVLFYERGLIALRDQKLNHAIEQFEKATEADAEFALAHARLAEALAAVGYGRRARAAADRALELAPGRGSPAEENLSLLVSATRARVFGRTADAVEHTERLVALFPDDPAILEASASALLVSGENDRALERIDAALRVDPLSTSAHLKRAEVLYRSDEMDEALTALAEAERLAEMVESPLGVARAYYVRGHAYTTREQFDDATREYREALVRLEAEESELLVAQALQGLTLVALMTGRTAEIGSLLDETAAAARAAGDLGLACRAVSRRGAQHFLAGEHAEAEVAFREAIDTARRLENDTLLLPPLSNLGSMLAYLGRREEARPQLDAAVALARTLGRRKTEFKSLRQLADIDYQLGNVRESTASYQRILERSEQGEDLDRGTAWTHLNLAEIRARTDGLQPALTSAASAIAIARRLGLQDLLGYGLVFRSQSLAAMGKTDEAEAALAEARTIADEAGSGLEDLAARCTLARGVLDGFAGRWEAALEQADRTLAHAGGRGPMIAVGAQTLACRALTENGNLPKATERCAAGAAMEEASLPDRVAVASLLGVALQRAGRSEQATEEARRVFEQAESMQLLLPLARAAVVLLETDPEVDAAAVRQEGRRALDRYFNAAPEEGREALRERHDLDELNKVLAVEGSAT